MIVVMAVIVFMGVVEVMEGKLTVTVTVTVTVMVLMVLPRITRRREGFVSRGGRVLAGLSPWDFLLVDRVLVVVIV